MAKKKAKNITAEMTDAARRIWLAGLGALAAAEHEGTKVFKGLVERGEELERSARPKVSRTVQSARGKVKGAWDRVGASFDERVAASLKRLGMPTRKEIETLGGKVERLSARVDRLQKKKTAIKKRPASRKKSSSKTSARKR